MTQRDSTSGHGSFQMRFLNRPPLAMMSAPSRSLCPLTLMGGVVEEGAFAADGVKELFRRRIEDDAEHGRPVLDQRRRDRPFRHMAQKGVGAVDRIDHPHDAPLEPRGVVLGLLREPAIRRPGRRERALQRGIDGEVGLAHLAAVELAPAPRRLLPEIAEGDGAGVGRPLASRRRKSSSSEGGGAALSGLSAVIFVSERLSKPCGKETADTRH